MEKKLDKGKLLRTLIKCLPLVHSNKLYRINIILNTLLRYPVLIIISLCLIYITGCKNLKVTEPETEGGRIRETVISYMSQPTFANKDFSQQITGTKAEMRIYNVDEGELYFSINKNDFDSASTINRLTVNPLNVQFGFEGEDRVILGKYFMKGTDVFFFRFPANELKIDTARIINIDFGKYRYTISLNELADFSDDKTVYGGQIEPAAGKNVYMANHGALVSIKNEPSIKRLAFQITGNETNRERIAQLLLDFVINNIQYSINEGLGIYEVLKRPNEVLMTGNSDCSGLTILYASLLEQYDIDYRLVYMTHHICVGVEGSFPKTNNLNFVYENKNFTIAETTAKDFRIGTTHLLDEFNPEKIIFIQKPGRDGNLVKFTSKDN